MQIVYTDGRATVHTERYRWEWDRNSDEAVLHDAIGRLIARYPLQPVVELAGGPISLGGVAEVTTSSDRLTVSYSGVNGAATLAVSVRFAATYYVMELESYDGAGTLVAVRYGANGDGSAGRASHFFVPGGAQDPEQHLFSAIGIPRGTFSLGASRPVTSFHQQPFLPSYLFAFYTEDTQAIYRTGLPAARSAAACMGLGAVPAGNAVLTVEHSRFSASISHRGDLWETPPSAALGMPWVVGVGDDWYSAAREYVHALIAEGWARRREDIPDSAYWPEYDTWGDQIAREKLGNALDQESLEAMYADLRASGLRAKLFVIDDLWESAPGALRHCERRLPRFDQFRERLVADGMELGLWTAFPRCGDFRDYGLDESAVLRTPDGTPYFHRNDFYGTGGWYIFDPTNSDVQRHFRERATELVHRYRPKLVKIDFGYEIPTLDDVAPHDMSCGGDRLFAKFLDVIVTALKAADPEITVQYYSLTPLLAQYWDHLSLDDMWISRGNFDDAFSKRAIVASIAGELGLPVYGSTGYDWASVRSIWMDSAVLGTIGSMAPFAGDIYGQRPDRATIAKYNGLTRLGRTNARYDAEFLDPDAHLPLHTPLRGPSVRSWGRRENGELTVLTLRPDMDAAEYRGLVSTTAPVVMGTLDERGLHSAGNIGIVPFGDGEIRLNRPGSSVKAWAVMADGSSRDVPVDLDNGIARFTVTEEYGAEPVEIIVVETSS